ncbi:hypothetical protein [Hydrogenophaga sp.]|uniref:hypothetical protein n=1 Tax=Hydrogenophaga sp. TaxID=1904254 RepID=UPI003F72CD8C
MKRREWMLLLAVIGLLIFVGRYGIHPRQSSIEWREEVKLHDGRSVLVQVRRNYERRGGGYEKYSANSRLRSMTISFNMDSSKVFEHEFVGGTLQFLDEKDGKWYLGYNSDSSHPSVKIGNTALYPHVAVLHADGSLSKPGSWDDVPVEIKNSNILPATPNPAVISRFHQTTVGHEEKMLHWSQHPTGAGWGVIHRVTPR